MTEWKTAEIAKKNTENEVFDQLEKAKCIKLFKL